MSKRFRIYAKKNEKENKGCRKTKYWQHLILVVLAITVFCFWLFLFPFIPVVREMSQLFLWTGDYFVQRIVLPGGLAQYIGELIGQFFLNPVNGAIAYTILFIVTQQLSSLWLRRAYPQMKVVCRFVLSLVVPAALWALALLPQIPLTVTMAIIMVMGVGCMLMTISPQKRLWAQLLSIPVMYWLAGPAFDAETGRLGQQVDTLINAATTGKSVTWPRPSYDDRYIMYIQMDYGYFSVWHPEADLWLLDLQTGETHPIDEVNSQRVESLPHWTPNSRWFLFTNRRDDGLYTRIYFSSIDANGKATKPFLLPQRNPKEYYSQLLYSFNTPDFSSSYITPHARDLGRQIENDKRVDTKVAH